MGRKSQKPSAQRKLSTIELTVLGLAWTNGPCTTYVLMKELSTAGSTYYRSRAGTTYSVVKRLIGFRLLSCEGDQVQITEEGKQCLRAWVKPPIPEQDVAHSADLLRLRLYYFALLEPDEQISFITEARRELSTHLGRVEWMIEESERLGDYFGVLALSNAVLETKARLRWLDLIEPFVREPIQDQKTWAKTILSLLREP